MQWVEEDLRGPLVLNFRIVVTFNELRAEVLEAEGRIEGVADRREIWLERL